MNPSRRPGRLARLRQRPWWPWAKRIVVAGFAIFIITLLVIQGRSIEWGEVFDTLRAYPFRTLVLAASLAALSHLIYSSFDLIGRYYTDHKLPVPAVMAITFVSYAFNLNLGTVVGAVAMRVRLYSRLGLDAALITRIVGMSMLTNWLGYFLLAGLAFLGWPLKLPPDWVVGVGTLRVTGVILIAVTLGYLGMCALAKRREWTVRGHDIALPRIGLALVQLVLSTANWAVMGAIMFVLLQGQVDYPVTLGVLLIGAVAGLLSRIPAGLGILEAVFVALLSPPASRTALIAAVLVYRAAYYWTPLAVASALYLVMEINTKNLTRNRAGIAS